MAITATIQSVNKIGDNLIGVQFTLSDGTIKEMQFQNALSKTEIKDAIKAEVARLNTIESKVAEIATDLVGKIIT